MIRAERPIAGRVGVGLYGFNGHQIHRELVDHPWGRLVAVAGAVPDEAEGPLAGVPFRHYPTLDEMLGDEDVQLVSLCSPRRADQPGEALRCLAAHRHVWAEKPSALDEPKLDTLLAAARSAGVEFHEQAVTALWPQYAAMRDCVRGGRIGEVVQVLVQKSYPYAAWRPADEAVDGGLFLQVGIHGFRLVEHVAGVRIREARGWQTTLGDPRGTGLRMAAACQAELENGGMASITMNYLNQTGSGHWANERLVIFGSAGYVEYTTPESSRLVVGERDCGPLQMSPGDDYLTRYLKHLCGAGDLPFDVETEFSPLRGALRARRTIREIDDGAHAVNA